jgi:hypothetical protein
MPAHSLIDRFMPAYSLRQVDRLAVAADPEQAWKVVRALEGYRLPFVRLLFALRAVPDRALARVRGRRAATAPAPPKPKSLSIDAIANTPGPGFIMLGEEPEREVVVGSVGKFWQPSIEFAAITPETFAAFDRPGFGKVAWCLRVDPREDGGAWISFDLRVGTTDPGSLSRFRRYWWIIGRFSHAIRRSILRQFRRELRAGEPEATRKLPGDDILSQSRFQRTHAVTIEAPPSQVWPWLVQMGARRAGWYSFDLLDNGGVPSAERIVPELQKLAVGDLIPALPRGDGAFAVLRLEPERLLVLGDPALLPGATRQGGPPQSTTWAFRLEPIGANATRLTVRVRAAYARSVRMAVMAPLLGTAHEIMERRQLHNLRRRAEGAAHPS